MAPEEVATSFVLKRTVLGEVSFIVAAVAAPCFDPIVWPPDVELLLSPIIAAHDATNGISGTI